MDGERERWRGICIADSAARMEGRVKQLNRSGPFEWRSRVQAPCSFADIRYTEAAYGSSREIIHT